ncbi:MAG: MFS transporter [Burkholderiaceae bacterium]
MSDARSESDQRRPWLALGLTLTTQTLAAVSQGVPTVLAPVVAPQLGLAPERIGVFVGLLYVLAMFSGLAGGGYVRRYGALRFCQLTLLLGAAGLALLPGAIIPMLLLGAVGIGMAYGLANPSAADMLGRHAPPAARGLIFSIKQTGVPLGVALAGLIAPWLYLRVGWQATAWIVAASFVLIALAMQPARAVFDRDLDRSIRLGGLSVVAPLRMVFANPGLRRLAWTSLVYAVTQICLLTFLVAYLKLEHGFSLTTAAAVLASAQLASIVGRPFWGHVADRYLDPATLLGALGLIMGVTSGALALLPASPSLIWVYAVSLCCAATAIAWNGVFYAELVRVAPRDQLATITGGTQFMTFLGGVIGPIAFAQLVSVFGSYSLAYTVLAVLPMLAGGNVLWAQRRFSQPA